MYQIGSVCEDCLQFGLQNYLKPFYINLEEQITKCESSQCMFPYIRKPHLSDLSNYKPPLENTTCSIDEFIEQSWKQFDATPTKQESQNQRPTKLVKNEYHDFDFSAIFSDPPIKSEINEKKTAIYIKQEQKPSLLPTVCQRKSNADIKPIVKPNRVTQIPPAKKTRISRCFSNVKTTTIAKNAKKKVCEKIEPVLVIEPQSGKPMRPLDLIKRYVQNKPK